jgi:hypothetical protein
MYANSSFVINIVVLTPESRAYTAGYIFTDALIKNVTINGSFCEMGVEERMKQFLNLIIAVCVWSGI